MLENNKIMQEAPKTIDYNEEIAVEQLKENLEFMEKYSKSIAEIRNELEVIDREDNYNARKWREKRRAEGKSIKHDEFLKEIGEDRIEYSEGLRRRLELSELRYHLWKRNFEYFLDYYVFDIVRSTIIKYDGKRVGVKTEEKISETFKEKFIQSDFGMYLEEKNKNNGGVKLYTYINGKEVFGMRRFHITIMGIDMYYSIFDDENEMIDSTSKWFKISHLLYDAHDIIKLADVIKDVYKEMNEELIEFNENREAFNYLASGACEYVREPVGLNKMHFTK